VAGVITGLALLLEVFGPVLLPESPLHAARNANIAGLQARIRG
jgi:hypothetical protein